MPHRPAVHELADQIRRAAPVMDPAPMVKAHTTYPWVRALITRSPHNTVQDVHTGRLTADVLDQIIDRLVHTRP